MYPYLQLCERRCEPGSALERDHALCPEPVPQTNYTLHPPTRQAKGTASVSSSHASLAPPVRRQPSHARSTGHPPSTAVLPEGRTSPWLSPKQYCCRVPSKSVHFFTHSMSPRAHEQLPFPFPHGSCGAIHAHKLLRRSQYSKSPAARVRSNAAAQTSELASTSVRATLDVPRETGVSSRTQPGPDRRRASNKMSALPSAIINSNAGGQRHCRPRCEELRNG